jgi:hypothetical protein
MDAAAPGTYRERGTSSLQRLFRAHLPELLGRYDAEFGAGWASTAGSASRSPWNAFHRIGQTRRVFTYRLIARDTVEERIQELQKSKLELGSSIITEDNSLIRTLTREDLALLLS